MAENIFTELYNKILGLFGQTAAKEESKNTAVNRLRLVLMQDRTNLTPEIMHRMRSELIEVLSTYVELDKEALELNFEQEGEQMALMLSIPVVRAKDESEIEASIKEKEALNNDTSEQTDDKSENSEADGETGEKNDLPNDDETKDLKSDENIQDETQDNSTQNSDDVSDEGIIVTSETQIQETNKEELNNNSEIDTDKKENK